ncbi:MAG: DNA polymerase III subunit gamma/tau, partial [Gemmatimonadetes bacterium]|nr:DNA polymerase III subunit gamma/tau [Gemmatimonadota bacterium]
MSYQVTARKWRPRRFDQVVGQEHITTTLTNALSTGRIAQCYLLCGPRGVGKTTTARILAKALNCANVDAGADPCDECPSCKSIADGTSMDVLEIDGASNNSVDDVRDLREAVHYIPSGGSHKIYIIDEVHMLSTAAFNALLKTLEEPPERVVFVFATTEVQEVPETILSRCQRFNFRRIATKTIADHLRKIVTAEQINADDEALFLLARRADGALRDAESLLDQVVSFNAEQLTAATVGEVLGLVDGGVFFDVIDAIFQADTNRVLGLLSQVVDAGGDVDEFVRGLIEHIRHLLFVRVQGSADQLDVTDAERDRLATTAQSVEEQDLLRSLRSLMDLEGELRRSLQPRFRTELALVRLAGMGRAVDVGQLLARLAALEAMGYFARGPRGARARA